MGRVSFLEIGPAHAETVLGKPLGQLRLSPVDYPVGLSGGRQDPSTFISSSSVQIGPAPAGGDPPPGDWHAHDDRRLAGHLAGDGCRPFCRQCQLQNSVRELNLLDDLLAARPAEKNIAFNFGEIESGYTGSTFEGLWVAGRPVCPAK